MVDPLLGRLRRVATGARPQRRAELWAAVYATAAGAEPPEDDTGPGPSARTD